MKVFDDLHQFMHVVDKKSSKVHHNYSLNFDLKVRHTFQLSVDGMVYADSPPAPKRRQKLTSAGDYSLVKLRQKKSGPCRVVRATLHTVTNDINGLRNIVTIDRVMLSLAVRKINQDASGQDCDN